MRNMDRGLRSDRPRVRTRNTPPRGRHQGSFGLGGVLLLLGLLFAPAALGGHTPNLDGWLRDWCVGAPSNVAARVNDSTINLACGNCSLNASIACLVNADCTGLPTPIPYPASNAGTCQNVPTAKTGEFAWWDDRADGAVNDLASFATTQDAGFLYFGAELWVDPDPVSFPFAELAIDYAPGGAQRWHDPLEVIKDAGTCSSSINRACTSDADCHFCAVSQEPTAPLRPRTCGSGCNPAVPADVCITTETCTGRGTTLRAFVGRYSDPAVWPDFMIIFDFSRWFFSVGDAVLLMQPGPGGDPTSPWEPVLGCTPDFVGDTTECDFAPQVNPGASGGSGGPPGGVEVAIPWSAFPAGTLAPGVDFRFDVLIVRGNNTSDFRPDGAIEDNMSEVVAGINTKTMDSCAVGGTANTICESADDSGE